MTALKVIAFDLFGTVFDASGVDPAERRAYIHHVRLHQFDWKPLVTPKSWRTMPPHGDSVEGLAMLRANGFIVVTLSNWPKNQIEAASNNAGITWDHMVLLEHYRTYKPTLGAYAAVAEEMNCETRQILMVTANHRSGDDTRPALIGMRSQLIRGATGPKSIIELAEQLGVHP
jgi:HAD superfamily hydrolase (TIGR01493 family)